MQCLNMSVCLGQVQLRIIAVSICPMPTSMCKFRSNCGLEKEDMQKSASTGTDLLIFTATKHSALAV